MSNGHLYAIAEMEYMEYESGIASVTVIGDSRLSLSKEPSLRGYDPLKNLQRSNFGLRRLPQVCRGVSLRLNEKESPWDPEHAWLFAAMILPRSSETSILELERAIRSSASTS
jgi:hypothetical protein